MKLNPQAEKIYEILKNPGWHCPIEWGYADGHTKRITDINEYLKPLGKKIESDWCNCGRHISKIKARRIANSSDTCSQDYHCWHRRRFGYCVCVKVEAINQLF